MAVVDENRYKSNSYRAKAEAERKEVQKVTKGTVRVHKKTTGEKIKESFFGENVENLGDYILFNLAIPAARDFCDLLFTNVKDILLYGEARETSGRRTTTRRGEYIAYDGYGRRTRRETPSARRARFDFSYIDFDTLDDIDDVVDEMRNVWDLCPEPKEISVAQFYQSADPDNIPISPTDNNWGWTDIRAFLNADRRRVRSRNPETGEIEIKWQLDLPRPKPLDY